MVKDKMVKCTCCNKTVSHYELQQSYLMIQNMSLRSFARVWYLAGYNGTFTPCIVQLWYHYKFTNAVSNSPKQNPPKLSESTREVSATKTGALKSVDELMEEHN